MPTYVQVADMQEGTRKAMPYLLINIMILIVGVIAYIFTLFEEIGLKTGFIYALMVGAFCELCLAIYSLVQEKFQNKTYFVFVILSAFLIFILAVLLIRDMPLAPDLAKPAIDGRLQMFLFFSILNVFGSIMLMSQKPNA